MTITVKAIGPYGVNDGTKWYKFGKGIKGADFTKGATYNVTTFDGKGGTFINKILSADAPIADAPVLNPAVNQMIAEAKAETRAPATNTPTKYGKPLSNYEVDQDLRIRRSGLIQASVQAVTNHVANKDQLVSAAIEVAEELLKWVNK